MTDKRYSAGAMRAADALDDASANGFIRMPNGEKEPLTQINRARMISKETGDLALIKALSGCRTESGARAYTGLYNAAQRLGEINRIARAALAAARKEG